MTLLRWLIFLLRSQTVILKVLLFWIYYFLLMLIFEIQIWISSDFSICSTVAFPPLGNSDDVVVSVSIDFPSYFQQDVRFHCLAYDYSRSD